MTVNRKAELQAALVAQLETALAGQGVDGADVPVLTSVATGAVQMHVRLDGWSFHQGAGGAGRFDKYAFIGHVFCEESAEEADEIIDQEGEALRVQNLIIDALDRWRPLSGEGLIEHIRSTGGEDETPGVYHGVSRFEATIEGT
jgi:hypothetical protein